MNDVTAFRHFPFSALVAQQRLQMALLLAAIDPGLGGVLIGGPRGTAKSTSARALADLLPTGRFVTLPLGASEAQLIGSLDVEAVLRDDSVRFSPGLLAKAHGGVLYVDEVNLLPDTLVDPLLDVAASGINLVERDGVSHQHTARFVLIGTMNPEEGQLRPQLADRFGLAVDLENCIDPATRQQIVKTRLAFDADPLAFCARYQAEQSALSARLVAARTRLQALSFSDAVHVAVSERCIAAGVDGLRADLVILKAARALAAFEQAETVDLDHVARVAEFALLHRRLQQEGRGGAATNSKDQMEGAGETAPHQARGDGTKDAPQARSRDDRGAEGESATRPDADPMHSQERERGRAGPALDADQPHHDGDWGYLAPEPVASVASKRLRPFLSKKV